VQGSEIPDPVAWGSEPQIPWSQRTEQNNLIVPLSLDQVFVPNKYIPEVVGLYYLVLLLFNFYLVSYKADGQLPILWKDVEASMLSGLLPSQVHKQMGETSASRSAWTSSPHITST
jgi:hypothetical protein